MTNYINGIFSIPPVYAHDYEIIGPVENVIYTTSVRYPCYVASTGDSQYYYRAASNIEQCKFAERARIFDSSVKMYCRSDANGNDDLVGIEYADTKANFKYPNKPL